MYCSTVWVTGGEIALAARVGSACEVELGCQQPLGLLAERPLSAVSSTGVGAQLGASTEQKTPRSSGLGSRGCCMRWMIHLGTTIAGRFWTSY